MSSLNLLLCWVEHEKVLKPWRLALPPGHTQTSMHSYIDQLQHSKDGRHFLAILPLPSSSWGTLVLYEPCHEKTGFLHMWKQRRRSAAQLISVFVFATQIVQSIYFLNPKFQASSHLLWLYSPVYAGPGRKSRRPVFSWRGSYYIITLTHLYNKLFTELKMTNLLLFAQNI